MLVSGDEEGLVKKELEQVLVMQYQYQIDTINTINDMHLVPPERPRWKSPQLRLFTKSQHSKRASSPKVTLGPCCSMFVSATLSPFKKMSPQAGRAIKARTDGARRRRMARQVE